MYGLSPRSKSAAKNRPPRSSSLEVSYGSELQCFASVCCGNFPDWRSGGSVRLHRRGGPAARPLFGSLICCASVRHTAARLAATDGSECISRDTRGIEAVDDIMGLETANVGGVT